MIGVFRAEAVRARSGLVVIGICMFAMLVPLMLLGLDNRVGYLAALGAARATELLFEPLAWTFVLAAFIGAYTVTREHYYGSLERTLVESGFVRVFVGKLLGAAAFSLVLTAAVCAIWTVGAALVLSAHGFDLTLRPRIGGIVAGALAATSLGALAGGAIGWLVRNYYVAAAIVLALPLVFEFSLLGAAPLVARFSPGMALAALSVPHHRDALLSVPEAAMVAIGWTVVLVASAFVVARRRLA